MSNRSHEQELVAIVVVAILVAQSTPPVDCGHHRSPPRPRHRVQEIAHLPADDGRDERHAAAAHEIADEPTVSL